MRIVGGRGAAALGAWVTAASMALSPVWAEPPSLLAITSLDTGVPTPPPPPEPSLDDGDLVLGRPAPPARRSPWLSLTGSVSGTPSVDLQALLERGEQWRLVHLGAVADPRPLGARMTVFGEIPYLADHPAGGVPGPGDTHEPASVGVTAEAAGFEVGAVYRSVGSRPERFARAAYRVDRRGPEVWVARRAGPLRVRVSQSRLWDNVDRDPALARTTEEQTAVTAELSLPLLPVVGLTYATGDSEREALAPQAPPAGPERHEFERVTGSLTYGGTRWYVAASSSVARTRDAVPPDGEAVMASHALSLSLRPLDAVSVIPAVSVGHADEDWSAASLALAYARPRSRWFASTMLSYTGWRTRDGMVDGRALGVHGVVGCRLGRRPRTPSTLSLATGYDRYLDAVSPENSSTAVWVSIGVQLAPF